MEYWWIILVVLAAAVLPAVLRILKLNLLDWILELFRRGGEKKEKPEPLSTVKWDCPYCGKVNGKKIIYCKGCNKRGPWKCSCGAINTAAMESCPDCGQIKPQ